MVEQSRIVILAYLPTVKSDGWTLGFLRDFTKKNKCLLNANVTGVY